MKFYLMSIALILFSCSKSSEIPEPQFHFSNPAAAVSSCSIHEFTINFEFESYSIDGGEPHPWNSKISGWIPDETDPTFYIITYDWRFCNFLELALEDYSFTVEEIGNPDGYWYEVTVSEADFVNIMSVHTVEGRFKRFKKKDFEVVGPSFN